MIVLNPASTRLPWVSEIVSRTFSQQKQSAARGIIRNRRHPALPVEPAIKLVLNLLIVGYS